MSRPSGGRAPRRAPARRGDALLLSSQICFPLYAAGNLLGRLYRPLLDELGLTYPQYLAMLALWEKDGQGVGELGDLLLLDSGTLSPLLKRLQQNGLVEKHRGTEDERRVAIFLTAAGRALRERALAVPEAMMCQLPGEPAQLMQLRADLWRFLRELSALTPAGKEST
jgi:DNA-binding MarR family transcriptional regulator